MFFFFFGGGEAVGGIKFEWTKIGKLFQTLA